MFRKGRFGLTVVIALTSGVFATAQGPRNQSRGDQQAAAATVTIFQVDGTVDSLTGGPGMGAPTVTILQGDGNKVTVNVGAYGFLQGKEFQLKKGDRVSIRAFQSRVNNHYLAVDINNLTTGASLTLRDQNGVPLWSGRAGGYGKGAGTCLTAGAASVDLAGKAVLEGSVDSVNMGLAQGFPNFTLVTAEGKKYTVVVSPFRELIEHDFRIAIGDKMNVLAFPSLQYDGAWIAQELKNMTSGTVLTLRDENGVPLGVGQRRGPGGCAGRMGAGRN